MLVGGIAGTGMMPIVQFLSAENYENGVGYPGEGADYFGRFRVMPGGTLMDNEVAMYPVANRTVAANAIITNPLHIDLEMLAPANDPITLNQKQKTITALKSTLNSHTAQGGWYNVATPAYIYQGCLLLTLTDETEEHDGGQTQLRWIWRFMQPLITIEAAQAAQNQAMAKISNQTRNAGDPPGSQPVATGIGQPSSNIVQNVVPSTTNLQGANLAPSGGPAGRPASTTVSPISPGGGLT